jgi:hypothetical protein
VALRRAFGDVTIPAGLKERVGRAVAREQTAEVVRRFARFGTVVAILAVATTIGMGLYGLTKPRLDTESLAYWNGYEAEPGQVQNLVFGHLPLPDPFVPGSDALEAVFHRVHTTAAISLSLVLALHAAAALKHQFVDRDGLLTRMIRGR